MKVLGKPFQRTISHLVLLFALVFSLFGPLAQTASATPFVGQVTPTSIQAGTTVTLNYTFSDPGGLANVDRVFMGLSPCNVQPGEAYNSNFERRLSNFIGVQTYPNSLGTVGIHRTVGSSSCTGGQYGESALEWFSTPTALNVNNLSNTVRYNSISRSTNGNAFTVSLNVTFLRNFPAGTYYLYGMILDKQGVWHTGSGSTSWYRIGSFTVSAFVNDAPTDLALSATSVQENKPVNTVVGTFSATDPDYGSTFTYDLVSGTGSTDNASFNISGNQLRTSAVFDREAKSSYSIRVRVTDDGGKYREEAFTITVTNVNEAPTNITLSSTSVAENKPVNTTVGTFTTTDPDSTSFTYSLVAGTGSTDNAKFNISGNTLRTSAVFDREAKSSYSIRVQTSDGALTYQKAFTINVTNVNEAPTNITLSNTTISENLPVNTVVGTFSATDPDSTSFTYSLVSGTGSTDNAKFNISGANLRTSAVFDYETGSTYSIRVQVSDGSLTYQKQFTIPVLNVNEAPSNITLSNSTVAENLAAGATVGTLSASDPDAGATFTFALVSGTGSTDNGLFEIAGTTLRTKAAFDFEAQSNYSIRVRVTDQGGLTFDKVMDISVADVNEAPHTLSFVASPNPLYENQPAGTTVGTLSAIDPDNGAVLTYTLVDGEGGEENAYFTISGNTLKLAAPLDYETRSEYRVRVQVSDQNGLNTVGNFVIFLLDVEEGPTDLNLSTFVVDENVSAGSPVATILVNDPDEGETITFALVSGSGSSDNNKFEISGDTLSILVSPNFEERSAYSIRVRATDSTSKSVEKVFMITINDLPEAPTGISLDLAGTLTENSPAHTLVGTLTATDPDLADSHTFMLFDDGTGELDNDLFSIEGNELFTAGELDFETKSTYRVGVVAIDTDDLEYATTLTVSLADARENAPTEIILSENAVDENNPVGTLVGLLSASDADLDDSHTFSLVAGDGDADNASFTISGNELLTAVVMDYETKSSYSIRVQVTDLDGNKFEQALTITVNDLIELTVGFSSATFNFPENGRATITVVLNQTSSKAVRVNYYTAGDTAVPGLDYTDLSGALYFAPGQTTKSFTVPMVNNLDDDGPRKVLLFLENPSGAVVDRAEAELVIADDETDSSFSTDISQTSNLAYDLAMGRFSAYIEGVAQPAQLQVTAQVDPDVPLPANMSIGSDLFEVKLVDPETAEDVEFTRATVCFPYTDSAWQSLGIPEDALRLMHYENGQWVDITLYVDAAQNQICGRTTSFSPFIISGGMIVVGGAEDGLGGQIVLEAGSLTVNPALIDFGTVALTGVKLEVPGTTAPWAAADATGSGAGWRVDVSAGDFQDGNGHSIPVDGFKINLVDEAIELVDGNAKPTSLLDDLTPLSAAPLAICQAPAGTGMGQYTLTPTFTLDVPPSTYAGSYTSIVNVVAVAGP